jgi:hypothetical protein
MLIRLSYSITPGPVNRGILTNTEIPKRYQTDLARSRDLSLDLLRGMFTLRMGIIEAASPTGCFLTDSLFLVVPFLILVVVPLFFVAMGFLQFVVDNKNIYLEAMPERPAPTH